MEIKPVTGKLLPLVMLFLISATGQAEQITEYAVKAAIVVKITKFVNWPTRVDANSELIRFCVAGSGPILAELAKLQVHSVHGRSLAARGVTHPEDSVGACDVLYIGHEIDETQDWLDKVSHMPVLTVGETKSGGDAENVVLISIRDNKVRFAVDVAASDKAGLTIGAQLLQLAAMSSGR